MEAIGALVAPYLARAEDAILVAGAVFVRISIMTLFMPGFGERMVPMRVKLACALAFAVIVAPIIWPQTRELTPTFASMAPAYGAEAAAGALLGFATRALIYALQIAGALAAQSLSLSQMFGAGIGPDPEPTIGTMLTLAAIALAFTLGLHVELAALLVHSYDVLPFGVFPLGADAAGWTVARVIEAFEFAISIALPFIVASFLYNVAIGAINRAMPQLMVALIGMPAITGLGLAILFLTGGAAVTLWHERHEAAIVAPFDR